MANSLGWENGLCAVCSLDLSSEQALSSTVLGSVLIHSPLQVGPASILKPMLTLKAANKKSPVLPEFGQAKVCVISTHKVAKFFRTKMMC